MLSSSTSYQHTKLVKQGREKMNANFASLASWINDEYGVKPLNIIYDTIDDGKRPRLRICFEYQQDEMIFLNRNSSMAIRKQEAIGAEFARIVQAEKLPYATEDLWVIYDAFEPIAKAGVMERIPGEKIKTLERALNDSNLWLIMATPLGIRPGFFLYSDEQVKAYGGSQTVDEWTDLFYALLKPYDEFDYFQRQDFSIYLDSKENFDTNFRSNWYYYFK